MTVCQFCKTFFPPLSLLLTPNKLERSTFYARSNNLTHCNYALVNDELYLRVSPEPTRVELLTVPDCKGKLLALDADVRLGLK
jgi:hypothetical protein